MKKSFLFVMLATASLLLASCIDSEDAKGYFGGYFTIVYNGSEPVLYADGGGIAYPTSSSVSELTQGKGLGSLKRAYFYFSFTEPNATTDANGVPIYRDVELLSGESVITNKPLKVGDAALEDVVNPDSISDIKTLSAIWCYNGYLSLTYTTNYVVRNNTAILPTLNMLYEPDPDGDIRYANATFYLNLHKTSDDVIYESNSYSFTNSFDLSEFSNLLPTTGIDTVTISLKGAGIKEGNIKIPLDYMHPKYR